MATVTDITVTPTSGLNHIDALLDTGPDWNYLTPAGNTILYTFSVASGNEASQSGQVAFTASQQTHARAAFAALAAVTGITFTETANGLAADVHLAAMNIAGTNTSGLCSWNSSYNYSGNTVTAYDAQAYVYLDNAEFAATNANLTPGTEGYQTLLHELGHMIGLKHPFEGSPTLSVGDDNTGNTLLSYTNVGGPYAMFSPYDVAALKWLYGGDGLGGALGINSTGGGRYITGTSFANTLNGTAANDRLEGDGGDDTLNGGSGTDTAVFRGNYASYTVADIGGGKVTVTGADGVDTLTSIEILKFTDQDVPVAPAADTTAPAAPTITVSKNANGYVAGDKPVVSGSAEANAKIEVYNGATLVAATTASAGGAWSVATSSLADGLNLAITARATDAANNVSAASAVLSFNVDTQAPAAPTGAATIGSSNAIQFTGTGEPGSTIRLTNASAIIGEGTVGSNGNWMFSSGVLPNGSYDVSLTSLDKAGNSTTSTKHLLFTLTTPTPTPGQGQVNGGAGNDVLAPTNGNNTIDGGAGNDTVNYTTPRSNYDIVRDNSGFVVTDKVGAGGTDLVRNVEAIKFSDSTLKLEYDDVVQALYLAYFGRAADSGGLAAFQSQLVGLNAPLTFAAVSAAYDMNSGLHSLIDSFGASAESAALYPGTTGTFINAVYQNIFNRAPDAEGGAFWTNAIDSGNLSRANASLSIMAGALENTSAQGLLDGKLVNNKITIASDFTLAIDTPAEVGSYASAAAAATVRAMLASVTANTDIAAFQATIASTLLKMSGAGVQSAASTSFHEAALPVQQVALVGLNNSTLIDLPL